MRKLCLFLFTGAIMLSCNKDVSEQKSEKFELSVRAKQIVQDNADLYDVFKILSYDEARSALGTMEMKEIQTIHLEKLLHFSNTLELNSERIKNLKLLEEIILELPNTFDLKVREKIWLEEAKHCFSDFEILNLGYSLIILSEKEFLDAKKQFVNAKDIDTPPITNDCNCNKTSAFSCISGYAGNCKTIKCNSKGKGCGFIGQYGCDGRCSP